MSVNTNHDDLDLTVEITAKRAQSIAIERPAHMNDIAMEFDIKRK